MSKTLKDTLQWLGIFAIIALITIVTKPSDEACIADSADHVSMRATGGHFLGELAEQTGISSYGFEVNDYLTYKVIYSRLQGKNIGVGIFGTTFFID